MKVRLDYVCQHHPFISYHFSNQDTEGSPFTIRVHPIDAQVLAFPYTIKHCGSFQPFSMLVNYVITMQLK